MPQKKSSRRVITPLLLFSLAGWALWALGRNEPAPAATGSETSSDEPREAEEVPAPAPAPARERATWSRRRLATSLAFVTLFFAGAAFSAGAGDAVVEALEGETTAATSTEEEPAAEEAPAEEEPPSEEQPAEESTPAQEPSPGDEPAPEQPPTGEGEGSEQPAEDGGESVDPGEPTEPSEPSDDGGGGTTPSGESEPASGGGEQPAAPHLDEGDPAPAPAPDNGLLLPPGAPAGPSQLDPEAGVEGFFATIWRHRTMPDPTPPTKRLSPLFAKTLAREARRAKVDWALVLGVLRAGGFDGGTTSTTVVRRTADGLVAHGARRNAWRALVALRGRISFADRALALTRYNRAVGLHGLVSGLKAAKPALQRKVLRDRRLSVYPGGRLDVAMGRTDVRVLVLLEYLAESHRQVTVSSLTTGHRLYSRPGVISAHVYGLAVDVAGLEEKSIFGNQGPNSLTERAVRNILLLPAELQPRQVISLLGLGGPSFPLADHDDHIHVGY
jgi:hypothetical protein